MHIVHLSGKTIFELHRAGMRYQLGQMGRATLAFTWLFRSTYRCPDCGCSEAYASKRRTFVEKYILPLVLLRQVRCANCFRKVTVSIFNYCAEAVKMKAIAVKKELNLAVFSGLQEMGVLRCDACGEEFVIGHSPHIADRKAAEKQAYWLEKVLADDHERQKKHAERIELPSSAEDRGASRGQERRSA